MNPTILVVDDEPDIRDAIKDLLSFYAYNVICAASVSEAKDKLQSYAVNLIISDVMMPETRGTELYRYVVENNRFSNVPFIFMTGYSPLSEQLNGVVLHKPFDYSEMIKTIESALTGTGN